jgi:hypothetical protein
MCTVALDGASADERVDGERGIRGEPADKPGSVEDSHSSRVHVAVHLKRPTRGPARATRCGPKTTCPPIWSCSEWGLPCRRCCHRRGALLPHHFTLTAPSDDGGWRCLFCGTFRGLAPPRRYLAPCPVEPGLSSPEGLRPRRRLPGRLPLGSLSFPPSGSKCAGNATVIGRAVTAADWTGRQWSDPVDTNGSCCPL